LADEFVVELVESGDCEGMAGAGVLKRIAELRRQGEALEVAFVEESLDAEERNVLYESLFWPGDTPRRELVLGFRQALRLRRARRDHDKLQAEIERAEQEKDSARLTELYAAKVKSAKRLQELGRPPKMLAEKSNELV
jgi:hypothetical protein